LSEREENDLIADSVRRLNAARRKAKLIDARLYTIGSELRQLSNDLCPPDPTRKADLSNARRKLTLNQGVELSGVLDAEKIAALIDELLELRRTIEVLSDVLNKQDE
jgi:hypothetical protein